MHLAPGVYSRVYDDSLFVSSSGSLVAAMIGTANKGPVNTLTDITSPSMFLETFGEPTTMQSRAAYQFSKMPGTLKYGRIVDDGAAKSSTTAVCGGTDIFDATAKEYGVYGDDLEVKVKAADSGEAGEINVVVYYKSQLLEEFSDIDGFTALEALDSDWVTFTESAGSPAWPADWTSCYDTYSLTGGDSGIDAPDMSSYYIGNVGVEPTTPATGLHLLDNVDDVIVDVVSTPGVYDPSVISAGLELSGTTRQDCLFFPDAPSGLTYLEADQWIDGTYGGGPSSQLNSEYGAFFYPYGEYYDEYSKDDVMLPPSAMASAVLAYSWYNRNPYIDPAGARRGVVDFIDNLEYNPSPEQIALTYSKDNHNVNWFRYKQGIGNFLDCQKTLYRTPAGTQSALNRISTMTTLNVARRRVKAVGSMFSHEPSEESTWDAIQREGSEVMEKIQAARGIREFTVQCDADTNPASVQEQNMIKSKIGMKPMTHGEWIWFDWYVVGQDATLS